MPGPDDGLTLRVLREAGDAEIDRLRPLLDAAREHDHHEPLGEHKWLDLVHGGRQRFAGIVASEPDHEHPAGYAHLSRHPDRAQWGLEIVVHPEHRGVGVEAELVAAALRVCGEEGGGHLHLWVFQPSEMHDALAHRFGLTRGRDLLHMRVPLPVDGEPAFPDDVRLRAFEPGRDDDAWLEVNNRAFSHHPEQGAWDRPTLERRMAEPWFDASGFLIAEDDQGIAAFCWTKLDADRGSGEIYVIGVDPRRRAAGLGRAMVLAGLRHMASDGCTTGTLYVDAANEAAVRLYRDLGFEAHHTDRAYTKDVSA
jgi:mycothiol synthase